MAVRTLDEWLSLSQAAVQLGCSAQSVRDWAEAGKVIGVRTPLGRLVSAEDVARLAAERRGRPAGDAA
jgi:predicted site-specific integrase-resolvase